MSVKRLLYSLFLYLIFPLIIFRLLWKSLSNPAYRMRISERLGLVRYDQKHPIIWVHAVSVGETIAAKPLIESLLVEYPEHRLLVTTTTPTGSEQVKKLFSDRVLHFYFPYDLPEIIFRFLNRLKPKILIVIETEIWPNLYAACKRRDVPLLIVNARLSSRSTQSYLKIKPLISEVLGNVSFIAARSQADKESFLLLGANNEQISVTGNIKFDANKDEAQIESGRQRRIEWGVARPVWLAASTHKGEDEQLLSLYDSLLEAIPELLLIIVPRHPERFDEVFQLCHELKTLNVVRHSKVSSYKNLKAINIILGDSMGEMQSWIASADVVFMGGSLVETGGHNPLEATVQGVPVVSGQHMFNFEDIAAELINDELLFVCVSLSDLETKLIELFSINHTDFANKAEQTMQKHRGVTARLMNEITSRL